VVEKNKQAAVEFLKLVVAGKIGEAYQKYVAMDGKHHNVFFPAGFPALQKAMEENHIQFPDKRLTIKSVLGDDDFVAVHSNVAMKPDDIGLVTVHIFRFSNDKIAEMWDCGQAIPKDSPNADGAF
jgi:predicted SnoaL-like aldol condensation-catalyzing enzyme